MTTTFDTFLRDDPGHPLGRGMPSGGAGGRDTGHHEHWMTVLRREPCAYCGGPGGTVDHVQPRCRPERTTHTWLNLVGACERCNGRKGARPLLSFLLTRRAASPRRRGPR